MEEQYSQLNLAMHFGFNILPARPANPRDKGPVENAVRLATRWIVLHLRKQVFHSIEELNARILQLLERLNDRPMRGVGNRSRRDLFLADEKTKLRPLPETRFSELRHVKSAIVPNDYHVAWQRSFYSAPSDLIGQSVDIFVERDCLTIFHQRNRIATHRLAKNPGETVTLDAHRTSAHLAYAGHRGRHFHTWGRCKHGRSRPI